MNFLKKVGKSIKKQLTHDESDEEGSVLSFYQFFQLLNILFGHQTTKTPILFSTNFSQFEQLKNFSFVQNWKKTCFGPIKSQFSFSTAKTEKNSWKRLVVWWFDVTNKIHDIVHHQFTNQRIGKQVHSIFTSQLYVLVFQFYNLGHIQGIIRVH